MAIAFSGHPVGYSTARADTSAHLRADLNTALSSVGWTAVSTLTSGFVYSLTSPQGLNCHCRVQDTGRSIFLGPSVLDVQFLSTDGSRTGETHDLPFGSPGISSSGYIVQAGVCQLFIKKYGYTYNPGGGNLDGTRNYNVCGGIPAIPATQVSTFTGTDACLVPGAGVISELWWSNGGDSAGLSGGNNFRSSRFCYKNYTTCKNGSLFTRDATASETYTDGPLQLLSLTPSSNVDFFFFVPPTVQRYASPPPGTPLNLDAMLSYRFQLFGQLWDAFCKSKYTALDDAITTTEVDTQAASHTVSWESYNYDIAGDHKGGVGTWYNTLYLATTIPSPTTFANYAY